MGNHRSVRLLKIAAALAGGLVAFQHLAADCLADECVESATSQAGGLRNGLPFAGICSRCGEKVCVTYASPGKETRQCWDVECVEVCIPPVRFPWQGHDSAGCADCPSTPLPRCGKVRCVRRLKAVEYECDACEYEHRIVRRCHTCGVLPHADCVPPPAAVSAASAASGTTRQVETASAPAARKTRWAEGILPRFRGSRP